MVTRKGAQREPSRDEPAEGASVQPSSPFPDEALARLPPPPQLPADGVSLIAPRWTRGRGNDHAEPSAAQPMTHRERAVLGKIGRYEVLGRVHQGREVSVYLARSPYPNSELVALKLSRSERPGPVRETSGPAVGSWSQALRSVAHPSLCPLLEITEHESRRCVVHAWLDGVPLDQLLTRLTALEEPMPAQIAASIVAQLSAGIDHAEHMLATRGVPESAGPTSIRPNDVMLCPDGRVVLLDLRWRTDPNTPRNTNKSVPLLGELLSTLLTGDGAPRDDEPAPFSFRVRRALSADLSEIVERTRTDHQAAFSDALALSTALQHFLGYESNEEERAAITRFIDEKFPDAAGREPPIQAGKDVRRALCPGQAQEDSLHAPSPNVTDVSFGAPSSRARRWLWLAAAALLVVCGYLMSTVR